jgi:hypothetical protein
MSGSRGSAASQVLLTAVLVVAGLVAYHLLVPRTEGSAPPADTQAPRSPRPRAPELDGDHLAREVAALEARVSALEKRAGHAPAAKEPPPPGDLRAFRSMLEAARRAEAGERRRAQIRNTVRQVAKGAAPAEIDGAVDVLARYYEGVRSVYADAGEDLDAAAREALRRRVDALQAQAEKDLRPLLGDEVAERLRRTLPGGTRGGIGAVSGSPRRPR